MKHAVYAGTFKPFTSGHDHILQQALPLFDRITVAAGINPAKTDSFLSIDDTIDCLKCVANKYPKVVYDFFSNQYLVNYAASIGAQYIIRGLRNPTDFEYEQNIFHVNKQINPDISTIFIAALPEYAKVSSSLVKGLIGPDGWQDVIRPYIPDYMWETFIGIVSK